LEQLHENAHIVREQTHSPRESSSVPINSIRNMDRVSNCQLAIDNRNGLIFSSSAIQISGTAKYLVNNAASYSILISDENSDEVARIGLRPEMSGTLFESSFSWDLKSRSNSYVKSGRYTISLAELSNEEEIELCSLECLVADTREILETTALLKSSQIFSDLASRRVLSIYADIIRDIEIRIIEGLEDNRFDEPYFVARTTAGFIRQIYNDIENDGASQFRPLIEEFVSRNPGLGLRADDEKFGLRALFDFLVNYMADPEDLTRATAMIKCDYRNFTANDRSIVLSALVSGILPHCMSFAPPNNAIGKKTYALVERLLKVGIIYICAKHIDKSISICRATLV
jgi:hypothetical protein